MRQKQRLSRVQKLHRKYQQQIRHHHAPTPTPTPIPTPKLQPSEISTTTPSVAEKTKESNNNNIYHGDNIHAYTSDIISSVLPSVTSIFNDIITDHQFQCVIDDLRQMYGEKEALSNMQRHFHNGRICDPELPKFNSALLLKHILAYLRQTPNLHDHFRETLDQISNTCIQGISHRLLMDWLAFSNSLNQC